MNQKIKIPETIEEAVTALDGVGKLLTAKNWERAALVYAFTTNEGKGRPANVGNPPFTMTAFAALGITGLTHRETIADYREAWESAMESGSPAVKPGDTITMPNLPWPPGTTSRRGSHGTEAEAREFIVRNPQVAVDAVKAVPAVAAAVTTAIAHDTDLTNEVERKAFAKRIGAKDSGPSKPISSVPNYDYDKEVDKAIDIVSTALDNEESGAYKFDAGTTALLALLGLKFKARADRYAAAQPEVHGEIDDFLKSSRGKE